MKANNDDRQSESYFVTQLRNINTNSNEQKNGSTELFF